ncbi:hypothetical protein MKW94_011106 [Papaver nudicaule]|uniref:DNA-directed RNA polymerase III subunit RPC3 n=1 Tax=Papaver nudicaule TaxID=74823 RepID=A0AA41SMJ6_PAPNU|nr:hypothetical protein [Papaver nudicaule]
MVLQNGIALASSLIRTHFGDLVGKVCECLLRKGTLTLPELIRFTELPSLQVKNCLLVLIQHNCVLDFSVEKEGGIGDQSKMVVHYTALFDNIIHRMRFSKFLAIVTEELDKECKELFEGLLQHGRLTLEQVILRAVLHPEDGNIAVQDGIRASFVKLVNAHYVERCPDFKPSIPLPDPEEKKTTTAGRAPKSAKLVAQREKTQEEEAIAMSACSEGRRFDITINYGTNVKSEARIEGTTPILVGEKRKHESLESEHDSEKEDLWRVNFDEFVRRLRHKACVTSVRSQLDDGAGTVLNAMLEATRRSERKVKTDETDPLSINTIYQEVINREEGRTMDLDRVRNALVQLECQIIKESSYSANLKNIIEKAQNTEVESIVEKRYGMDACRIYRFLSQTGHLAETDKVVSLHHTTIAKVYTFKKSTSKICCNKKKDKKPSSLFSCLTIPIPLLVSAYNQK